MRRVLRAVAIALALFSGLADAGCGRPPDGLSQEQRQTGDRLSQIGQRTGGDWDKLTAEEREFVIKMAYDNEKNARMLLLGAAGKIGGRPGGPPR